MTSLLHDAMAHHIWATERLIDACQALTPEQLRTAAPGTYGSIYETFAHMVRSDGSLSKFLASTVTRRKSVMLNDEAKSTFSVAST